MAAKPLVFSIQQAVFLEPAPQQGSGAERENPFAGLFGGIEAKFNLALESHRPLFLANGEELFLTATDDQQEGRAA